MSEPPSSVSRAQTVAQHLERAIVEGQLGPEARLPSERELSQRLGVSRSSVREGIGLLVAQGMLCRKHGDGTFVTDHLDRQMAGVWFDMVQRHPTLQDHLVEFRESIERRTAELAAQRSTARDRARLKRAGAEVDDAYASGDRKRQIRSDVAFHRAIADASHNPVFSYLIASLLKLLHEQVQLSLAGLAPKSDAAKSLRLQHREILDAILAGDGPRAASAASQHLSFVKRQLNDFGNSR